MTEMKSTLKALQVLRDETQLKMHLASMDLSQAWDSLQPKLKEAERLVQHAAESASEATLDAIKSTAKELHTLSEALSASHAS
ncbi:MAG: hypothetical protein ABI183_12235 [Polyangiaceae bacterium]